MHRPYRVSSAYLAEDIFKPHQPFPHVFRALCSGIVHIASAGKNMASLKRSHDISSSHSLVATAIKIGSKRTRIEQACNNCRALRRKVGALLEMWDGNLKATWAEIFARKVQRSKSLQCVSRQQAHMHIRRRCATCRASDSGEGGQVRLSASGWRSTILTCRQENCPLGRATQPL
jgi:hypothetical protein